MRYLKHLPALLALAGFILAYALSKSAWAAPNFGPQSSAKAQEWGFDFVEEFDGLADWNMSSAGRVGNQYDDNSTGLGRMPKLANGSQSSWGYYSKWADNRVSTHSWIGGTEGGTRQVWRGSKSASMDLGDTANGPSRLGLYLGEYSDVSFFYMVYIPKNHFPTFCVAPGCASNGLGEYVDGQPYIYWGSYKFNTINFGCGSVHCPDSGTYGLHTALTLIKKRNYTPIGVVYHWFNNNEVPDETVPAMNTQNGTNPILDQLFGDWMGIEVRMQILSSSTFLVNMWAYDRNGNAQHVLVDRTSVIELPGHGTLIDQFFFGGNNSNSWVWGPTMVGHYYIDDFVVDDGSKGRIGPRYFAAISGTTTPPPPPVEPPVLPVGQLVPMRPVGPDLVSDVVNDLQDTALVTAPVIYDIDLAWSHPTTRIDNSTLALNQISGYVLNRNGIETAVPVSTSYRYMAPGPGNHTISIATMDTNNQRGPWSAPITVVIPW